MQLCYVIMWCSGCWILAPLMLWKKTTLAGFLSCYLIINKDLWFLTCSFRISWSTSNGYLNFETVQNRGEAWIWLWILPVIEICVPGVVFIIFFLWIRQLICDIQLFLVCLFIYYYYLFFLMFRNSDQGLTLRKGRSWGKSKFLVQYQGPKSA